MNERKTRRLCVGMVLFAITLRVLCASGVTDSAAHGLVSDILDAGTHHTSCGQADGAAAPEVWPVRVLAAESAVSAPPSSGAEPSAESEMEPGGAAETPETAAPEPEKAAAPLEFSAAEADAIAIGGACTYAVDKRALLLRPSALDADAEGPKVLIVHTHSSEAYTQEAGWEYDSSDPLRTENPDRSVIRIGTRIAEILEDHGIETLHDTALNDYPSYNGAYERMRLTIEDYLADYPSIQMVLDIHRDAAEDAAGMPVAFTAEVDGQHCAQLMLVVGTDQGGLTHPDWAENLANSLKVQALLNRIAPGLCRDIDLRTERFNQHETPGSMLVEFGCTGNTLAEALRSAEYLGQALCTFWDGLASS